MNHKFMLVIESYEKPYFSDDKEILIAVAIAECHMTFPKKKATIYSLSPSEICPHDEKDE